MNLFLPLTNVQDNSIERNITELNTGRFSCFFFPLKNLFLPVHLPVTHMFLFVDKKNGIYIYIYYEIVFSKMLLGLRLVLVVNKYFSS